MKINGVFQIDDVYVSDKGIGYYSLHDCDGGEIKITSEKVLPIERGKYYEVDIEVAGRINNQGIILKYLAGPWNLILVEYKRKEVK